MTTDTRTRILDTALAQFVARGVGGVAVTEIEEGAGLSPGSGSFYRHFRSKDDVLSAVVTREIDRAVARSAGEVAARSAGEVAARSAGEVAARSAGDVGARSAGDEPSCQVDLSAEYLAALAALDDLSPLIALLVRDGSRLPHVDRIRAVLAEGGARVDASHLRARMAAGEIPERDAEAVASVALFALVGHHLAEQFFGRPVGVDRARFAAALASLVET